MGTSNGGGYLNSVSYAQSILNAVHAGEAEWHQAFKYIGVTGTNVNVGAGVTNQATKLFMVKRTVSPSIVPINPNWLPC